MESMTELGKIFPGEVKRCLTTNSCNITNTKTNSTDATEVRSTATMKNTLATLFLLQFLPLLHAFAPSRSVHVSRSIHQQQQHGILSSDIHCTASSTNLHMIGKKRRDELGISDDEDEYDLDVALNNNTDPFITKVIAGSFILAMIALLVVGLV